MNYYKVNYVHLLSGDIGLLQWALRLKAEAALAPDQTQQIESLISTAKRSKKIMAGLALLLGAKDDLRVLWQEWESLEHLLDQLLEFDLPNHPENFQDAVTFSEALLAKYRERAVAIYENL